MAYQVLARRRRPQTFADLVGQDHVTRTLTNALAHNRVAHAYLFTGARGVGKTSAARILAKCLNCDQGPTATPCNTCAACHDIAAGVHIDVIEIDGASNTGVDNIRDLRETVHYLPQAGKKKVYIIDEVHMLSTGAFNALLKTLEEPPAHVVFIFATTEPHKVLPTIISRCQRFDFHRIPVATIVDNLRAIADDEGVTISDAALATIAREAEGGLRDAQSLLERILSGATGDGKKRAVTDDAVLETLGVGDRKWLYAVSDAIARADGQAVLATVSDVQRTGRDPRHLVNELVRHYRNLAVMRAVPDALSTGLVEVPADEGEELAAQAERYSDAEIQIAFSLLTRCAEDLAPHRAAANPWLIIEMALLKATHARPTLDIDAVLDRLAALEGALGGGGSGNAVGSGAPDADAATPSLFDARPSTPTPSPQPARPPASPAPAASSTPTQNPPSRPWDWREFIRFASNRSGLIGHLLEECAGGAVDGDTLTITPAAATSSALDTARITDLAQEFLGRPVQVVVTAAESNAPQRSALELVREESSRQEKTAGDAQQHPLTRKLVDDVGGTIVSVRVGDDVPQ